MTSTAASGLPVGTVRCACCGAVAAATYGATTMLALGFCNALQNGESNSLSNALDGIKHTFHVTDFALGVAALLGSVGASWGAIPIAAFCSRHRRVSVLAAMFTA